MTAIWLGLSNVFSNTNITQQLVFTVDAVRANFVNSYKAISPTTRTNIFFFAILALGSYLSFSSVVAIPSLQEPETQDRLKSEELKERLKAVALTPNDFDNKFPKPATDLKYVSRMISGSEQETDGARTTSPTADLVKNAVQLSIRLLVGNWSRTIDQLRSQWANLRNTFNADQSNLIDVATETFDLSNRGRKGVRETQQHFLAIELWYRRWWTQQATQLNQCREAVERYASEAGGLLESIGSFNTLPSHDLSIETAVITEALKRFSKFENDAKSTCAVTPEVYVIPAREDFGGYLGIFGTAARWLLKTEFLLGSYHRSSWIWTCWGSMLYIYSQCENERCRRAARPEFSERCHSGRLRSGPHFPRCVRRPCSVCGCKYKSQPIRRAVCLLSRCGFQ